MKMDATGPARTAIGFVLAILLFASIAITGSAQHLPRALIITGNGNVPAYQEGYPPWIHEFQNDMVVEILKDIAQVDITTDLSVLRSDRLNEYDLVISNSIFLSPEKEQLDALYQFVAGGKAYFTIHCGILSLLNWDKYEEFIGGIFIGGPASLPREFKVVTANIEFWGYPYTFRKQTEHPVSAVAEDFVISDELYHFQSSTRDFNVIARAENLPVMWWHPVGKGKVMSLTLGHDSVAKSNPGYQSLLRHGVQWLTGMPLIHGKQPKILSDRSQSYNNFMALKAIRDSKTSGAMTYGLKENDSPQLFTASVSRNGQVDLHLHGKTGNGRLTVSASEAERTSSKAFNIRVVRDGTGNIASYHGNSATSSSNENNSGMFDAMNVVDGDSSTRWSSGPFETATITLDLQKTYSVKQIVLEWEASYATAYSLLGSTDGKRWKPIVEVENGDGGTDVHNISSAQIRYLKLDARQRFNKRWGYSLYEIKVFQE